MVKGLKTLGLIGITVIEVVVLAVVIVIATPPVLLLMTFEELAKWVRHDKANYSGDLRAEATEEDRASAGDEY